MTLHALTPVEETRLRELLEPAASVVIATGPAPVTVYPLEDGTDRIAFRFGDVAVFMSGADAEQVASLLFQASARLQNQLERAAKEAE
jgi:hypothetical protein